ncbi:MAG: helix-turn-helix transcriptional regulator [Demequina sp.]|uniref:helix-turn-helix domain-containing protein n=1 Tax=Demequina sp. TaxID=2050685 RepID=UPI0019C083AD|nr:helix-turn-helix domain-containing protein [Demequina sp.]MBC7298830.1 helix-turn-helix transcriptional regulator [Demequina sp.]
MDRPLRTPTLLGIAIRTLRLERGLTQQELAERSGTSRRWIIDLEAGKGDNARLGMVLAVFDTLDTTLRATTRSQ